MTFIPVGKPVDGMMFSWTAFCPECWDNLWWRIEEKNYLCRSCAFTRESENITADGKIDLKYNPLADDEEPFFSPPESMTWRTYCHGCKDYVADDANCHPFVPGDIEGSSGRVKHGTRWLRDGTRYIDFEKRNGRTCQEVMKNVLQIVEQLRALDIPEHVLKPIQDWASPRPIPDE